MTYRWPVRHAKVNREQLLSAPRDFYDELKKDADQEFDPKLRASLSDAISRFANVLFIVGSGTEADKAFVEATELLTTQLASTPSDLDTKRKLAITMSAHADLQYRRGQFKLAIQTFAQVVELQSDVIAVTKLEPDRETLAYALTKLSELYAILGDLERVDLVQSELPASRQFELSQLINAQLSRSANIASVKEKVSNGTLELKQRVQTDPDPDLYWALASNYLHLASLNTLLGDSREALRVTREAKEIADGLVAEFPGVAIYQDLLGNCYYALAVSAFRADDDDPHDRWLIRRIEFAQSAIDVFKQLIELDSGNRIYKQQLAHCLSLQSSAFALDDDKRAVEITSDLVAAVEELSTDTDADLPLLWLQQVAAARLFNVATDTETRLRAKKNEVRALEQIVERLGDYYPRIHGNLWVAKTKLAELIGPQDPVATIAILKQGLDFFQNSPSRHECRATNMVDIKQRIRFALASAAASAGDVNDAIEHVEILLANDPHGGAVRFGAASVYARAALQMDEEASTSASAKARGFEKEALRFLHESRAIGYLNQNTIRQCEHGIFDSIRNSDEFQSLRSEIETEPALPEVDNELPQWVKREGYRGAPFDVEQFIVSRRVESNAAPKYLQALSKIGADLNYLYPAEMRESKAREVRAIGQTMFELIKRVDESPETVSIDELVVFLERTEGVLSDIDACQEVQGCLFAPPMKLTGLLSHLTPMRTAAQVCYLELYLAIRTNDLQRAEQSIRRALACSRAVSRRGGAIAILVADAIDGIILEGVEKWIVNGNHREAGFCRRILAIIEDHKRQMIDRYREGAYAEYISARNTLELMLLAMPTIDRDSELVKLNRFFEDAIAIGGRPAHATLASLRENGKSTLSEMTKDVASHLVVDVTPPIRPFWFATVRNRTSINLRQSQLAVKCYWLVHGTPPQTLAQAITESGLAHVPIDKFTGEAIRMGSYGEGVVVYSIGIDGVDDQGLVDWQWGKVAGDFAVHVAP